MDILPSLLTLLNISYNKSVLTGNNFSSQIIGGIPLLLSRLENIHRPNYAYLTDKSLTKFAITDGEYKFVYSTDKSCKYKNYTEELYDIKSDPEELKEISTSRKDITDKLKLLLFDYIKAYNLPDEQKPQKIPTSASENTQKINDQLKSLGY